MKVLTRRSQPKVQVKERKGAPSIKPSSVINIFNTEVIALF